MLIVVGLVVVVVVFGQKKIPIFLVVVVVDFQIGMELVVAAFVVAGQM